MSSEPSAEPTWAVGDILRHRVGSEWKLVEHLDGKEHDDWVAECIEANRRSPGFGGRVGEHKLFHREYMDRAFTRVRRCPDGGKCHHGCARTECFRVRACGPLSDYGEDWKPEDVERFGEPRLASDALPLKTMEQMLCERELTCRGNAAEGDISDEHRLRLEGMADAYKDAAALLRENIPPVSRD